MITVRMILHFSLKISTTDLVFFFSSDLLEILGTGGCAIVKRAARKSDAKEVLTYNLLFYRIDRKYDSS